MNPVAFFSMAPDVIADRLYIRKLKAKRAAALKHIDVAKAKIENEQAVISLYQEVEMQTRRELRDLGVKVD